MIRFSHPSRTVACQPAMRAALSTADVVPDLRVREKRMLVSIFGVQSMLKVGPARGVPQWHGLILGFANSTRLKGPSTSQSEPPRRESRLIVCETHWERLSPLRLLKLHLSMISFSSIPETRPCHFSIPPSTIVIVIHIIDMRRKSRSSDAPAQC